MKHNEKSGTAARKKTRGSHFSARGYTLLGYAEKIAAHREAALDEAVYQEAALRPEGAVAMKYLGARNFLLAQIAALARAD